MSDRIDTFGEWWEAPVDPAFFDEFGANAGLDDALTIGALAEDDLPGDVVSDTPSSGAEVPPEPKIYQWWVGEPHRPKATWLVFTGQTVDYDDDARAWVFRVNDQIVGLAPSNLLVQRWD